MGLLNLLTPNILQQIRVLNQGFFIELQYPRTRDRYQFHNVVPKKGVVLILVIKALLLRQNYNVNPSLKPLLAYLSGTKNLFLKKDTSAERLYLDHSHIVATWVIVPTGHLHYSYFILTNPLTLCFNDMTIANFRNWCLDCTNCYLRQIQSLMISQLKLDFLLCLTHSKYCLLSAIILRFSLPILYNFVNC